MSAENLNWFDNVESRSHSWPGLNWVTTAIVCEDARAAVEFYERSMFFVPIFELPGENGELLFARMRYRGNNFTLNKPGFDFEAASPPSRARARRSSSTCMSTTSGRLPRGCSKMERQKSSRPARNSGATFGPA